jgi:hypothetical protein
MFIEWVYKLTGESIHVIPKVDVGNSFAKVSLQHERSNVGAVGTRRFHEHVASVPTRMVAARSRLGIRRRRA